MGKRRVGFSRGSDGQPAFLGDRASLRCARSATSPILPIEALVRFADRRSGKFFNAKNSRQSPRLIGNPCPDRYPAAHYGEQNFRLQYLSRLDGQCPSIAPPSPPVFLSSACLASPRQTGVGSVARIVPQRSLTVMRPAGYQPPQACLLASSVSPRSRLLAAAECEHRPIASKHLQHSRVVINLEGVCVRRSLRTEQHGKVFQYCGIGFANIACVEATTPNCLKRGRSESNGTSACSTRCRRPVVPLVFAANSNALSAMLMALSPIACSNT